MITPRIKHKRLIIVASGLVIVLAIGGFIIYNYVFLNSGHASYQSSDATELTISRNNTLNQPGVTNFTMKVSNSSARIILKDIDNMNPIPNDPGALYSCPNDDGVAYILNFKNPSLYATAEYLGCSWLRIGNNSYNTGNTNFWNDINNATHMPIDPNSSLN